ncbi:MAG: hypothetical protein ABR608_14235 [Pseudonocardiaceae bacterium]
MEAQRTQHQPQARVEELTRSDPRDDHETAPVPQLQQGLDIEVIEVGVSDGHDVEVLRQVDEREPVGAAPTAQRDKRVDQHRGPRRLDEHAGVSKNRTRTPVTGPTSSAGSGSESNHGSTTTGSIPSTSANAATDPPR